MTLRVPLVVALCPAHWIRAEGRITFNQILFVDVFEDLLYMFLGGRGVATGEGARVS
jgi:hypothetical protein